MMHRKPIFSLSPALMAETIKRCWYLPALSFIIYFIAGILPLMADRPKTDGGVSGEVVVNHYLEQSLANYNVVFMAMLILLPLVAAVLMMNFLHKPARAMAIHAAPFSRNKIFCSQVLAGWLLCIAPVAVMFFCYLPFSSQAVMGAGSIFDWACTSIAVLTFFYGMYVLAGSLVGTSIMQVLLSGIFFIIAPLMIWLTFRYCENFLPGYAGPAEPLVDFMSDANPVLYLLFRSGDAMPVPAMAAYFAVGLVMLLLAGLAYGRARLERVGDSMMYAIFGEIVTWLVTFVGMTAMGFFLYYITDSRNMMLAGMFFGTVVTFLIVKIVLARSIRILTAANLRSFLLYLVVAVLFTSVTVFDGTHFAEKVPLQAEVASVERESISLGDADREFSFANFPGDVTSYDFDLTSPDAIQKVLALHQYIVDEKLYENSNPGSSVIQVYDKETGILTTEEVYVQFDYTLQGGRAMVRSFRVPLTQEVTRLLNDIVTCQEYKEDGCLANNIQVEDVEYVEFTAFNHNWENDEPAAEGAQTGADVDYSLDQVSLLVVPVDNQSRIKELVAALDKDYYNRGYTAIESIQFDGIEVSGQLVLKSDGESHPCVYFNVHPGDANTIAILKELCEEKGYDYYAKRLNIE